MLDGQTFPQNFLEERVILEIRFLLLRHSSAYPARLRLASRRHEMAAPAEKSYHLRVTAFPCSSKPVPYPYEVTRVQRPNGSTACCRILASLRTIQRKVTGRRFES
jgi:hypothetical protein